jgi:hypothetical protein
MNIGTCGHIIEEDWYTDERSSYYVSDPETNMVVYVTTCRDCWEDNEMNGLIEDGPVMDDFVPEVDENTLPDVVFDSEGNAIRVTEKEEFPEERPIERPLSSFFDNF